MKRRGHLGTLALVFGALFLVGFAIYSFYGFSENVGKIRSQLRGIAFEAPHAKYLILETVRGLVEGSHADSFASANFEKDFKDKLKILSEKEREAWRLRSEKIETNVFAKFVNGEYNLRIENGKYIMEINDLFYKLNSGDNEAGSLFSLKVILTKEGVLSVE